jgi:hypothetical protein
MSQLFQDSLVPWEKTAGCDAHTSNAKSVESAPEPCPVLDVLRLCSFSLSRAISRLFTVLGVATPPLGYAPLPKNYFQEELRDARKRGVSILKRGAQKRAASRSALLHSPNISLGAQVAHPPSEVRLLQNLTMCLNVTARLRRGQKSLSIAKARPARNNDYPGRWVSHPSRRLDQSQA